MLIGKAVAKPFKVGLAKMGSGLKTGNLSSSKVISGLGWISMGMLGTTALMKNINRSRDRLRNGNNMNRGMQPMGMNDKRRRF